MYKLTLTAEGYNRISFVFNDLSVLTNFLMVAINKADGKIEAKISLIEGEGEEDAV